MNKKFMRQAIQLGIDNIHNGGGPFGAVIVKGGEVISTGVNRVTPNNDPTAHAEVCAIREACRKLGTFQLDGCEIYSSCEPCPMCLGAIYWAHISHLYYGCNQKDANDIGFSDEFIYKEIALKPEERHLKTEELLPEEAKAVFKEWTNYADKTEY
ncbi:MAG: nucleoside deaminase [Bacteroidaceae bacterium]|nr:nucleoside deaminase [Bacteroidaceae bacterium]